MADRFGKHLKNVLSGTMAALAPGSAFNAGLRCNREVVQLDDGGAAAVGTTIIVGKLRAGDVPHYIELSSNVALTGISFQWGNRTTAAKYSGAVVGPAANGAVRIYNFAAQDALEVGEDIVLTTSVGALPTTAAAVLVATAFYSHK